MPRYGFIHDELDIKILIMYAASKLPGPAPIDVLTDLVLCDDGVDYFEFTSCLADLVSTGHIGKDDDEYYITEKGKETNEICQSSLAYSVRMKVDKNVQPYIRQIERNALVSAEVHEEDDGKCVIRLKLSDGEEELLDMKLYAESRTHANKIKRNFKRNAEKIFNRIITAVTEEN